MKKMLKKKTKTKKIKLIKKKEVKLSSNILLNFLVSEIKKIKKITKKINKITIKTIKKIRMVIIKDLIGIKPKKL